MSEKQRCWVVWLVLLGLVLTTACKKKTEAPAQQTARSVGSDRPEATDEPEQPDPGAYGPPGGPQPTAWIEPDLGAPDSATRGVAAKNKEPVASDADIAAQKEAKDREETEKAVETSVNGALGPVKACLDRHKAPRGQYRLSVRVHRSGRVLSSNVSGLGGDANRCVERVLLGLRVEGVKTDTITVTRQLKNW